ncbi:MAG TPA: nucleotidyltransferase family protein [Terriglobales bacterium]|nr:nucleotidyltransferase family protein [Terriglobales bacterium]
MHSLSSRSDQHMDVLSKLMFQGYGSDFRTVRGDLSDLGQTLEQIFEMSEEQFGALLELADTHHVTVRALRVVEKAAAEQQKNRLLEWCRDTIETESTRISNAVEWLRVIVHTLQDSGCQVVVIKSLDHWPDLGSDLDLYTSGAPERVTQIMQQKLQAELEPRSWGDKLANKWNFQVPGLKELIEIHVRYLGQTGEQKLMAQRVIERSVWKEINGRDFPVPAPEERILISTLQRMYRHFYFRLCDMADFAVLLASGNVNFTELRQGAELGGVWPGVASFLVIVANYVKSFGGSIPLPREVVEAAHSSDLHVQFRGNFLRVPMKPAAGLYGSQLLSAGKHGDLRAIARLPLLPPLAVSALVAFRLTGSDKGVW